MKREPNGIRLAIFRSRPPLPARTVHAVHSTKHSMRTLLKSFLLVVSLITASPSATAQAWTDGPPMPTARYDAAVAVLDGSLYVIGGRETPTGPPSGVVERFTPGEGWETVASLRDERYAAAATALNGRIVLMGGMESLGAATDDVEAYDLSKDDWESFQSMEQERSGLGAVMLNGHIYALGGAAENGLLTSCEAYDPSDDKWYIYPPWRISPPRASFGVAEQGGAAYLAGGFSQFGPLDLFERYIIGAGSTELASMSTARGNLALVSDGTALFAIGGLDPGEHVLSSVERYDVSDDRWTAVASLGTARAGAVAAYLDDKIYVVGGRDAVGNVLNSMEVYGATVDDEDGPESTAFALDAPHPNPFAERTTLTLRLAESGPVAVVVYDVRGRRVATLEDRVLPAGTHRIAWDGTANGQRLAGGVYIVHLTSGEGRAVRKLTLLR